MSLVRLDYHLEQVDFNQKFFAQNYSRTGQLQIIKRARAHGYDPLRIYDGIELIREEAEQIAQREYAVAKDFDDLITFAKKHDCIECLEGMHRLHLLHHQLTDERGSEAPGAEAIIASLDFKATDNWTRRLYFETLFLLHERYALTVEQVTELKRTYAFSRVRPLLPLHLPGAVCSHGLTINFVSD